MKFLLVLIFLISHPAFSQNQESLKLLDKIIAVINDNVITLSEVERLKDTLEARKEISPMIYQEKKYLLEDLVDQKIKSIIIRDVISKQGFIINDDAVEERIKMTENRLGLRRSDLITFLKSKGVSYGEYFEMIRETMEFNIFAQRVISPLISITEQELKSAFIKRNKDQSAITYKYDLVDFYLKENRVQSPQEFFKKVQSLNSQNINSSNLNDISLESLPSSLAKELKKTPKSAYSQPVLFNGNWHVFLVKEITPVASSLFIQQKNQIQNDLFMKKGEFITQNWFEREFDNYFIKKFL